ncbi:MAG: diaminopimelate epimerase [Bacteroidales bacterium]|nr:diaminopimelate epimerase [Bacteroidales bacterium]
MSIFAEMEFYKWSGAGNTFVVIDGRGGRESPAEETAEIIRLCREFKTDGLMILKESPAGRDFAMEFYNPDGSGGMMCGNGGRCIVAFADFLGIGNGKTYEFDAPDGVHAAEILKKPGETKEWTVRLQMRDVEGVTEYPDGLFLNTGTRHFVKFVPDVEAIDIEKEALPIRHDTRFAPEGTNVNFVALRQAQGPDIAIRTFEKGVEDETAACGTGITAAAIACRYRCVAPASSSAEGKNVRILYKLQAREAVLSVDFVQKAK